MSKLHLAAAATMMLAGAARPDDTHEGDFLFGIGDLAHLPIPDPFAFPGATKFSGRRNSRRGGKRFEAPAAKKAARKRQRKARAITRKACS